MKYILSGTNRPDSRSLQVAQLVQSIYREFGEETAVMDLREVPFQSLDGTQYSSEKPSQLVAMIEQLEAADGVVIVCPEYNGSMPGVLKYFIDHWKYPETFQSRPFCLIGLGGRFAGVRPVEHLQQVLAYREAYSFPQRVFIANVWGVINEKGELLDDMIGKLLRRQAKNFSRFVRALKAEGLDAKSLTPEDYKV